MTTTVESVEVSVPVGPALTMFDPVYFGIDEFGKPVYLPMAYRNILIAGEPGSGKSSGINTITSHAALSANTKLVLFDGKQVELGPWRDCADEFVGPDIDEAIGLLKKLQYVMDNRYAWLEAHRRREVRKDDAVSAIVAVFDELAYYSATAGTKVQQEEFSKLLRDVVARGRAAMIITVAATQRPSFDIIPTSLRDLFGYRCAFRCTAIGSSEVILGKGWAETGFNATTIPKTNPGEAFLIAEGGTPQRVKVSYLSDQDVHTTADYAAYIRRFGNTTGEVS